MRSRLLQYLNETLSLCAGIRRALSDELRSVPLYLRQRYELWPGSILDQPLCFAFPAGEAGLAPSSVSKDLRLLGELLRVPVVLVRERLEAWERGRYIAASVPFVVPGQQLFIPAKLMDLRETRRQPQAQATLTGHLTWAAQAVLLRHLLFQDVEGRPLHELALHLGYSRMTMTKVQRELAARGLCRVETVGRTRRIGFEADSAALWGRARGVARSPVRESHLLAVCRAILPLAGLSALAARTALAAEAPRRVAASASRFRDLIGTGEVVPIPDPDSAVAVLEVWNYDPELLTSGEAVDPFSLYLSLQEDQDERVLSALGSMMEGVPW